MTEAIGWQMVVLSELGQVWLRQKMQHMAMILDCHPLSALSADSFTMSIQPPCAIAYNSFCAHIKIPKHWQP